MRTSVSTQEARPGHLSPEYLEDLLENGELGLQQLAADGTILWANRAQYEPLGYARDEFVGQRIHTFHADPASADDVLRRVCAGEVVRNQAALLRCRDGTMRPVSITSSGRFDEQGHFLHSRCFVVDVSERSRESDIRPSSSLHAADVGVSGPQVIAAAVRSADEQLCTVADALPSLIAYIDDSLSYRFVNSHYEAWFERTRAEISGMTMLELLGPLAFEALRPYVARALAGENVTFEAAVPYRHAGVRVIRANYVPLRGAGGSVEGFFAMVTDISKEQKAAAEREELLRVEQSARERLAVLTKASDVLARTLDYDLTLQSVAELALPILGDCCFFDLREGDEVRRIARAHQNERIQQLLDQSSWVASEAPELNLSALATGRAALHPSIDADFVARSARDPEQVALMRAIGARSMITVPLAYQGATLGALTLMYGWSGRQHTEHDLALAEELASRCAAAVINARLFKEAREAIGVRDDFLSIAGHELRTPLTALQLQILSITKMINQPDAATRVAERAEKASRNVLRLSNLVNELLDISRISAGRLRLERSSIELGDVVRDVLARHTDELARNGCELRLEVGPGACGSWDRVRIEQITTNLLANAMKYGKGKPIEVIVDRIDGAARLTVRDHGIGISAEDQQRIFQRFERAVSSRHFGGLGLGLWIARQLVDAHGGTIRVNSEQDKGATFEVALPLSHADEVQA